jgi:hypothetical protein
VRNPFAEGLGLWETRAGRVRAPFPESNALREGGAGTRRERKTEVGAAEVAKIPGVAQGTADCAVSVGSEGTSERAAGVEAMIPTRSTKMSRDAVRHGACAAYENYQGSAMTQRESMHVSRSGSGH